MKKFLTLLLFLSAAVSVFFTGLSCSTNTPTAANNFQNPVQTVVSINTPYTLTFTPTLTFTSTFTPTSTPTNTPTPFATATPWTGFNAPSAIAVDGSGFVYVADTGNNLVGKYSSNGALVVSWGTSGVKGKISVTSPVGLAVDGSGNLFVAGGGNNVSEYDLNGKFVANVSAFTFSNPQGVAAQGSNIYVSDSGNNRLVSFTNTGSVNSGFGTSGVVTIPALSLYGLGADSSNNVAVACSDNKVRVFNSSGASTYTIPGFVNPKGVAFDSPGNLWVADIGNKQIEEFASAGLTQQPLVIFNGGGTLNSPKGVAVNSSENTYVVDSGNNNVVKFAP